MTVAVKSRTSKPSPKALLIGALFLIGALLMALLAPALSYDLGYAQSPVEAKKYDLTFPENSPTVVAQFEASDPEGLPIRWELSGDDAADFDILDGRLEFGVTPDFENPADRNRDNVYQVTVEARDPGFNIAPADVTVTVLNVDEPGAVTLSSDQPNEEVRIIAEVSDPDRITTQPSWQWYRSDDTVAWAAIAGATGNTYVPVSADVGSYLRATASYEDAQAEGVDKVAHGVSRNSVLAIPHVNRAPEFLDRAPSRSINENASDGAPVGDPVAAEDPDDDILTYGLSGADAGSFTINQLTGQVSVASGASLDFEANDSYSVVVTATDPSGESDSVTVAITVTNVNEAPVITGGERAVDYAENDTAVVERYLAVDPEGQSISWRLSGDDSNDFSISGGALTFNSAPDYEAPADRGSDNVYNITVGASDSGGSLTEIDVAVTVTNVDEGGAVTLSTNQPGEGSAINARLSDPDRINSTIRWQWARSADGDAGWEDITGAVSGIYTPNVSDVGYYLSATARYEDAQSATVTKIARATTANAVLSAPEINAAPQFLDRAPSRSVNENASAGMAVGNPVAAEDANGDTLVYTLSGPDAGSFAIDEGTGQISVGLGTTLDYETATDYSVTVTATDPDDESDTVDVAIMVTDVDEPPSFTVVSSQFQHAENATGAVTTFTATDPEDGAIGWSLSGDDADLFAISNGALSFRISPNFEDPADENVDNIYVLTIGANDAEGNLTEVDVTVTVTNVEEPGTVTLSTDEPTENGRITATLVDPDGINSRIRWQWARSTSGAGDWEDIEEAVSGIYVPTSDDAGYYLRATANYQDRESSIVGKRASATTADSVEGIPHVNRAPEFLDGDSTVRRVNENSAAAAPVGVPVDARDADNDMLTYAIGGRNADAFDIIEATGQIVVGEGTSLDFESPTTYEVTVTVADTSGATDSITVAIEVTNVDESPEIDLTVPGPEREDATYAENSTNPVASYTVGGRTEGFVWSVSGVDAVNFSISSAGILTFNSPPDFENPADQNRDNVYHININATDVDGKTGTSFVTVTVTDVNEVVQDAIAKYDTNSDGRIDREESLVAIRDYFNDQISKDEVLAVLNWFFRG